MKLGIKFLIFKENESLWRNEFIKTYLERDLAAYGFGGSVYEMRRLWEMLAWQNAGVLNSSHLARSLGVNYKTVNSYLDWLEESFMIRRIHPYYFNIQKRLVKSPKVYLADTGLLCSLLKIDDWETLMGSPFLGNAWESYVLNQVYALKKESLEVFFYRTHEGSEMDVVLVRALKPVASLEVTFTNDPRTTKSFTTAKNDLATDKNYIIVPEVNDYPINENTWVVDLKTFLTKYLPFV